MDMYLSSITYLYSAMTIPVTTTTHYCEPYEISDVYKNGAYLISLLSVSYNKSALNKMN